MELKDKTVIVTGSSRGIGKAIALEFAKKGANIVLNGRKPIEDSLIEELKSFGGKVHSILGDVSDFEFAQQLIQETREVFGSVDVLVNNAGITKDMLLMRMTEEDFDQTIDINLKGTFNTIRHASKVMLKQKCGTIINMSSVVGLVGNVGQANYAASKAGVVGLTKSAARELAARGISVNAIAPGFIETEMTEVLSEKMKEQAINQIPLKHFGSVEEVARVAVFLSENRYITGQVINVDGGMVMNG